MANAYSTPINYGQTVPTTDLAQYVGAIQKGMQQKFDINLAKIDDLISKVATVPLARDKDKRYLGDKLQGLLSMVDANSKVDLSDNVVARQISAYVTTAIDDNVKEQLANSQKISNYQQTAAQRKKDKPELYSDANYAYGLDKSGYQDYINEKTDSLGTMDYIDNYDVDKNLTKELEAFAKERGFEKVLDESVEGGYIYKTVKGKELTPQEISNFFDNKIATDPKLKQQFIINAHYNHRGVSDADIIKSYKDQSEPILKDFDTKITDIDEKLKNISADDKSTADLLHRQKSEIQQQKNDFSSQLDPKNFNRDSFLYGNYARSMKKSYMNTYAYSAITDVKYDDFLLKLATAKGEVGTATTGTVPGSEGLSAGTRFQIDESEKGVVKDEQNYLDQFNTEKEKSWNGLKNVIKARLVEEGKQPTAENITSYYTALKTATKNGINLNAIKGYDTEVLDAFTKVADANKTNYRLTKVAKDNYGKAANDILSGLWGGKDKDLNVEGLLTTMPTTGALLRKYKNPEQMTKKEKAIALYEVAQNLKDFVLEGDDSKNIKFYLDALKRENNLSDNDLKGIKQAKSGLEDSAMWDIASTYGKRLSEVPGNILGALTTWRTDAIEQSTKEFDKRETKYKSDLAKAWEHAGEKIGNFFTTDTNLGELQSGDIKLGKYEGVQDRITNVQTSVKSRFDEILKKGAKKEIGTYAIVLNPAIKKDEATVNAVNSAIVNAIVMDEDGFATAGRPVKDTAIKISNIKDGVAQVTYTQEIDVPNASGKGTKKGESQITVPIPLDNLPQELTKNLETQVGSWEYSGKNKSGMIQAISYSPPKDLDSKYDFTQNYVKNYGASLSQSDIAGLQTSGMQDVKTKEDYKKVIDRALPPEYAKEFTEKYLNSEYKVEWERPENTGSGFIGYLVQDGRRIKTVSPPEFDYNQTTYSIYAIKEVNKHLETIISDYRLKALRLRN